MISAKSIIVTAADDKYFPVARDLVLSIRDKKFSVAFDLGFLDTGLSEVNLAWLETNGVYVQTAKVDIDYPGRVAWEEKKPGFRTLTARLFMCDYFPSYDVYMWMDADVWVQTPEAINTMLSAAAKSHAIHMCCELDRSYQTYFQSAAIWHIFRDWYVTNYGEAIANEMTIRPMLNAGVWAMNARSPVWDAWVAIYTAALQKLSNSTDKSFMADQLGLNILLYLKKLPYTLMPSTFNWLTFYALPKLDTKSGLYVEPAFPHRPISQFHLTRPIKIQTEKIECLDGDFVERPLTYSAAKQVLAA